MPADRRAAPNQNPNRDRDLGLALATTFISCVDALHQHLQQHDHEVFRPYDGYLFRILHDEGQATVSELATVLGVTKQAASQAVQSLVRRGFAVVEADAADARRRIVRLSTKGEEARRSAVGFHDALERELVARLGAREVAAMREALDTLVDITEDDASPLARRLAQVGVER
jgi:DNA-binding MarR family transcriptional regulator